MWFPLSASAVSEKMHRSHAAFVGGKQKNIEEAIPRESTIVRCVAGAQLNCRAASNFKTHSDTSESGLCQFIIY
jgi:hypothetical protein